MSVTPLPLFIYLFILLSTLHFWQLNCHNILFFFFFSSFGKPQFFLFFSSLHFWQLNCHNFFFFSGFGKPQFFPFFFSLHFRQLNCHNYFFSFPYNFGNSIVLILFLFFIFPAISATPLPQFLFLSLSLSFWGKTCILGKNFNNYITEIQFSLSPSIISFLSPLLYFFLEFWQYHCRNLLLSSFPQISLNSVHITNKIFYFFGNIQLKDLLFWPKTFLFWEFFFKNILLYFA